jgi:hypothetical protein
MMCRMPKLLINAAKVAAVEGDAAAPTYAETPDGLKKLVQELRQICHLGFASSLFELWVVSTKVALSLPRVELDL